MNTTTNSIFMIRAYLCIGIALALLFSITPPLQAHNGSAIRYVAVNGVDEGDCLDPERPCQTIRYAIDQADKGDEVVVSSGTYQFDPNEMALLLSDMVPVRGPQATEIGLEARGASDEPTYIIGPSFEYREQLAERNLTLIQDRKGLEIAQGGKERAAMNMMETVQPLTNCVSGMAGIFPCQGINFLSQIPLSQFSSNPSSANDIWGFVDLNDDREYALIGLHNGTAVVDVTDPLNPIEVGTIPGRDTMWRDVKVYQFFNDSEDQWNAYAYVTADNTVQGLQIIDLTNLPATISLAATYHTLASAHNVYMGNTDYTTGQALSGLTPYAYIAGANLDDGAFRILDLTAPAAPVEVTAPPIGSEYVHDATNFVLTDSRTAYCAPGHNPCELFIDFNEDTVDIWDVTDKAAPMMISSTSYPNAKYTHSGWWTEDKMFIFIQDELDEQDADLNTTLRTLDISDLTAPFLSNVWTGPTPAIDHNGFVKGDRYYMSNYRRGLTILDITDPNSPTEVAFFDTFPSPADNSANFNGAWGVYPYLPSGTILVSDIEGGLFLLKEKEAGPQPFTERKGYVWANNATSSSYAPSAQHSYNSSGGPNTITRSAVGSYRVRFAGLGGNGTSGGHVQVTAYGASRDFCKVAWWSSTTSDAVANVRCFTLAGDPVDTQYTVLFLWAE